MQMLLVLLALEITTFLVIREHLDRYPKSYLAVTLLLHSGLSIAIWYLFIRSTFYKGYFDMPENISLRMNLTGMVCALLAPRFILSILHFSGKLFRIRKGGHIRWLTNTGVAISLVIFIIVSLSTFIGRYNFKTERITVKIKNLDPGLDGLKIVQISDLHLASFYGHYDKLAKVVGIVKKLNPDILINTGDFISYGWREFDGCDTILERMSGRYGSFAILGNHDMGTYMPGATLNDKAEIIARVSDKIRASGYKLLVDNNLIIDAGKLKVAMIGVTTAGRHPAIVHGDLSKAIVGSDSAALKIFLCHDPNQWEEDVAGKTDIQLTFSGHTHGMQIGIITNSFRWSPSKYFYPHWNGLYREGNQYQYVNRGLGTLAIPFRIWMPPEITIVTLTKE